MSAKRFAVSIISPPSYPHSEATREIAESIHYGLLAIGCDSILTSRTDCAHRRHIILCANLLPQYPLPIAPDSILYNLDQVSPESPWFSPELLKLFGQYQVWDYSQRNIAELARAGVRGVRHLPIGYVPQLTRIHSTEEDIDVLFYGCINERRLRVLTALRDRGLKTAVVFGVYGAQRDHFIARSRIALNIHFYEAKVFEAVRVSYLLANRRFVVSERGSEAAEDAAFSQGVVFADYDGLVNACVTYLARPEERQRVADMGFETMVRRDIRDYLNQAIQDLK
jgi:hypothetical protein